MIGWNEIIAPSPGASESGRHQLDGHADLLEDFREANEELLPCIVSDAIVEHEYGDSRRAKLLIDRGSAGLLHRTSRELSC